MLRREGVICAAKWHILRRLLREEQTVADEVRCIVSRTGKMQIQGMKRSRMVQLRKLSAACSFLLLFDSPPVLRADPPAAAVLVFNGYSRAVEARLAHQHQGRVGFLAPTAGDRNAAEGELRRGEVMIERVREPGGKEANAAGGLLHHWRGTAFVPGATAADFDGLMRNFNAYPQTFSPQVQDARMASGGSADRMQVWMRVRQHHVITVVMDTDYDVQFGRLDVQHGFSISRSTRVQEIDKPGTAAERAMGTHEEHGFLWRLNTYWSYEQRDGGLYLQVEAVSLTRAVPRGLGWAVGPYVESIPRESLAFTLQSARNAMRK